MTTKTDLLRCLKQYQRHRSKAVDAAENSWRELQGVLDDWLLDNTQYQLLKSAADGARDDWYSLRRQEEGARESRIKAARAAVLLNGPTPEVVAMVEAIAKDFA